MQQFGVAWCGPSAVKILPILCRRFPAMRRISAQSTAYGLLRKTVHPPAKSPARFALCGAHPTRPRARRRSEALRHAEAKYRSIVENAVEGIFQTTPDGHYLSANPALARIYGYDSTDELIRFDRRHRAATVCRLHAPRRFCDADGTRRSRDRFRIGNLSQRRQRHLDFRKRQGGAQSAKGKSNTTKARSRISTARKQSENLHREKEAAEAANRAKSQFLAHMSHELRTPLNGVIGMLDLLTETTLSQQQQRYASIARSSADLLLSVINEILDFSKIEAGKLELEHIDFDLRSLIESAWKCWAGKARQKGLELALHMPPELSMAVRGDPHRLQQVIVNLLGNAIKFTAHGQVQVRVTLESEPDENCVVSASPWKIPASASRPIGWTACSGRFRRSMLPPRGNSAALAWVWPSPSNWSN